MLRRRESLSVIGASVASASLALSCRQGGRVETRENRVVAPNPCGEAFADPPWKRLSSAKGDLPVPSTSDQQTGSMVGDIDGDGCLDFVITNRRKGDAAIWMQNTAQGRKQHIIDPGPLNIEAGGVLFDIDGDGRLDLVAGGDNSSNEVWWWENPHPDYDRPWKRHTIKQSDKTQHHDLMIGDVLGPGRPQLVFWNQGASALLLAPIPENPRTRPSPWDIQMIYHRAGTGHSSAGRDARFRLFRARIRRGILAALDIRPRR